MFRPILSIIIFLVLLYENNALRWVASYSVPDLLLHMTEVEPINVTVRGLTETYFSEESKSIRIRTGDENLAVIQNELHFSHSEGSWVASVNVSGVFLGLTNLFVEVDTNDNGTEISLEKLEIIIIRRKTYLDHAFTGSIIILMSALYINFGAALNLEAVKAIMIKPIGPAICVGCQFIFMPLLGYLIGIVLFPNAVDMALGIFFTGISPSGGASNIWTLILGGNLNLSISMTTISTLASFGLIPFWLFTLGTRIFDKGNIPVPYSKISTAAFGLLIPLVIGTLIQKFFPRIAKAMVRILKPMSIILILFIIIFAIITNLYIFQLFNWRIVVAGCLLPWIGYFVGWFVSKAFRQANEDATAISLETGIQNTGIAIYLLQFTLNPPYADITTVIPVSVAIMTPIPLLLIYITQLVLKRTPKQSLLNDEGNSPAVPYNATA